MEDGAAREDACREYQSSLEDLTFNSKPHINMLTILAEENIGFAKDIVAIIEAQISKAPSAEKLPVLYLVDSIVKNVGGEFLAVFAKNLITSFICVFEKVDENTRKSLFKLRSTWEEVFPLKKLYALDVRVNALDPAWPIKPLPPTVNASIHVNPKFLKQSDDVPLSPPPASPPSPSPPTPPPVAVAAAPALPPAPPAVSQSSLTQEQLIRQQLLAKQKQLLELQQKKIELELEQTKAQLAGGYVLPAMTTIPTPVSSTPPKPVIQAAPAVRPWIPPQAPADSKPSTRDPRLNRPAVPPAGGGGGAHPKDASAGRRESPAATAGQGATPDKKPPEKSPRTDKSRVPRKEASEEKSKSKSPSPMAKNLQSKSRPPPEPEGQKSGDGLKKDPRLKKRPGDKPGDDELKEKKRFGDKKEREEATARPGKSKLPNGVVAKHERDGEAADKPDFKAGGNARTHARKRTRSRSRSRSPASSPKRKERRSPKSRPRSSSPSPSPSHKAGKPPRRPRPDEPPHGKPGREDRPAAKKGQSDGRRSKRPADDRHAEARDQHSPRGHDGGKEAKEAPHRWRSGWEENKHAKQAEEPHAKAGPRHKGYAAPNRPTTPRTPKHRLSVDANLQIPDALNSASKKDLLRRASKRLESGEISQEDFLNMAHQIKHFFQYQEEKQLRSEGWEPPADFKKQQQPTPADAMGPAELSYYEHKSKLRKTQVNRRPAGGGEDWEDGDSPDEGEAAGKGEKPGGGGGRSAGHRYSRATRDRPGDRRSKEREEPRPPLAPMVEEYNHGKEFPTLKALPGLRFRRRVDPREPSEREWNSPLTERQHYDERDEHKSGYDAPRRYDARRPDGPPSSGAAAAAAAHRGCPSPAGLEAPPPRFERERLSPLHQKEAADLSPVPRFESPNSEHSDDGPLSLEPPHPPAKPMLKVPPARGGPPGPGRPRADSPSRTPPRERYGEPGHMGPARPHPPVWFEAGGPGRYDKAPFDGPLHPGPGRFEGAPHLGVPDRAEGPGQCEGPHMAHGPLRGGGDVMGHQGPGRYAGPVGQQPPVRYESPGSGGHLDSPMQRLDGPRHFNSMGPGSGPMGFQQGSVRFEGPSMRLDAPGRFEGPGQSGPRYDMPLQGGPPRFEYAAGQQGPPRFAPQQHGLQPSMRPMAPPLYEGSMGPQQGFPMGPQRFPEPMNPQFPAGHMAFPAQQQQAGGFGMQPAPAFAQAAPGPFYSPAAPGLQQPVNLMGSISQTFLQNSATFGQSPQVVHTENHFGQVDVNSLLSKLISSGIIKPSQPDVAAPPAGSESSSAAAPAAAPAAQPAAEEEDEDEQEAEEEDDVPDLTGFGIEDMKQRYENVVTKLYSGNQCCLCSMRFTAAQTDMYADHLDWHFRQNHAGKVASKKVTHRRWYYSLTDWIEFEEIADLEERAKSQFFEKENEEEVQKSQAAAKEKEFQCVRAAKDQVGELCEICQEPFETYWVEEEEDWFLKNALRVDDKNFHPSCFEDYKNTSSYLDVTPSPNKLLTDHPLGAFIKTEDDEETEGQTSCAVAAAAAAVKQEEDSEEPPEVKEEQQQQQEEEAAAAAVVTDSVKEEEVS